ncbi:hypothetical protein ACVW0Q_000168 [Thermostichus sp. MS-CIW-21]|jgi:hypothetical protein|uniref:hypothetical protein n=1 Tax=unclassified Synechococcus TaxID=2626047 RepID=UPI0000694834|nr:MULTISPECIES: hypothetical protein [unclassified Synechococcus]ABD00686.1 hypothetical protein CYA_2567 [Synechococcus sp. JA-3-3Ab]PIK84794.1 hypothetical protein SYN65AY6A5_12300 [Synechococcus sp. 65AY6A5]PIK87462.1 hypothetical protein SYN63AY4M2_08640 [Synechococcus sp. 63AY4M2]PIK93170.1 hypothetical protein SYN65AY6LI_06140 [Synechococcus sp. 65AY6Li]PIK96476.1 hypothetical protein SYN60AY4M2_09260 [Synechococcus sp. 60AY4M2]
MAALLGSLSQQVRVDEVGMQSTYPVWVGCAGRSAGPMSSALTSLHQPGGPVDTPTV